MNFSKSNIFSFLGGLSLLILPVFFEDSFSQSIPVALFYMLLITFGMSILIYFLAKIIQLKPVYIFSIIVIIEVGIYASFFLVKNNWIVAPSIQKTHRNFYAGYLRNIPAFQDGLGRYDSTLFYTLQPGQQKNTNIEFSNTYSINSQGVRDDEVSLDFPEIIVLGDSHSMGWGVEQEEAFADLLEKQSNQTVLNTGIVSYGSAREYLMFNQLKTDSCRTLIWQYCSNDKTENQSFIKNGNQLKISSKQEYQFSCYKNFIQKNYYPFKFIFESIAHQFRRTRHRKNFKSDSIPMEEEVSNFFKIVMLLQQKFKGKIVIFNLESYQTSDILIKEFEKYVTANNLRNIHIIDTSKILKEKDYFTIDGHINVSGHKKVSILLQNAIQK